MHSSETSAIDEPRALAASLIESLNSNSDIVSILKIKELFDHGYEFRNSILNECSKSCNDLSSTLAKTVNTLDVATRSLETSQYESELEDLNAEQTELNQSLSTIKDSINATNLEIEKTLKEINAIEKLSRLEMEAPPDSQVVKLSIYRSLGIDLLEKKGNFYGAQIRSREKNDIHTMEFNERFETANSLWKFCL